jgi:hypothetical protein
MRQNNEQAAIADAEEAFALNPRYAHACELLYHAHKALSEFHRREAGTYLERRKQIVDPEGKYGELPLFRS